MIGDSVTNALMRRALDGTWQRQKAISANIANHETPGYKAIKVNFEDTLRKEVNKFARSALAKDDIANARSSINDAKIHTHQDHTGTERADGNNVNLDVENIEMAKTQIQYQYLTRQISDYYSRLRYAISEGKR